MAGSSSCLHLPGNGSGAGCGGWPVLTPIVMGVAGPAITDEERAAIARVCPAGIILFARNVVDPAQLRRLTGDLVGAAANPDLAIMIDQEGGPVARLGPPHWPAFPAAPVFAAAYARAPMTAIQAARANGEALGHMLAAAGITMNAAPMLDLRYVDSDRSIGRRTLGDEPMAVAALGRAMITGMAAAGVTAIVKHMPGHGRARVDPHHKLPVIVADTDQLEHDLAPFRRLSACPAGMVGHVVYPAWDAERPASLSPIVIDRIIRGAIGFDGLLLSDDLHMGALSGSIENRAVAAIAAGCDLALCCHASPADVLQLADRLGPITPAAAVRLGRAKPAACDRHDWREAIVRRDTLLAAGSDAVRLALPARNA